MDILTYNAQWMLWNLLLACVPLGCIFLLAHTRAIWVKILLSSIWFLFLPNTLYILTDLYHLTYEFALVKGLVKLLLLLQFALFAPTAVITYVLSVNWFVLERSALLKQAPKKAWWATVLKSDISIYGIHLLVAFGVILGRIERTNSWDVIAHPSQVVTDVVHLLSNPTKVIWVFVFWFFICLLFSSFQHRLNKAR